MPLNGFLMGKSYLSDTAALSAEEFRQLTCMLDMFAKYGQEPEWMSSNTNLFCTLMHKYADRVYKKKLDKYLENMPIDTTVKLVEMGSPLANNYLPEEIEEEIHSEGWTDDDIEAWREERGLALNLAENFYYCQYGDGEIRSASDIYEYASELYDFIAEYGRIFDGHNGFDICDPDGDRLEAEYLYNLQIIIDHGDLIDDPQKRNEFLRTFEFDFER